MQMLGVIIEEAHLGYAMFFPRSIVIVIAVLILYFHRVLIFSATLSSSTLEKTGYC